MTGTLPNHDSVRATLARWIPAASDVAIVDVPVHRNVGDLFILSATLRLLADLDCRIVYCAGARDYRSTRARRVVGRETIVVGLGGGNFGDRYPHLQDLRERVIADFPQNRIVILPQTVHFADRRRQQAAVQRLRTHADLHIAVRDHVSLQVALECTPDVQVWPDVVHGVLQDPLADHSCETHAHQARRAATLMRRDGEAVASGSAGPRTLDWPDLFPEFLGRLAFAAGVMPVVRGSVSGRVHGWWSSYAHQLLARARIWMGGVEHLVTDRLHAAILARLAGRQVTLCETGYGKLTAYYDSWWRDDPMVVLRPHCGDSGAVGMMTRGSKS